MEIGFHTLHFSPMFGGRAPMLEVLGSARHAGFTAIGLDGASIDAYTAGAGSVADLAGELDRHRLRCTDLAFIAVGSDAAATAASGHRMAEFAAVLRPDVCVAAVAEPVSSADALAMLGECAAILGGHGVRLAIEFAPYLPLSSLAAAVEVCGAVGWDRAGVLVDSLHFFRSGADWDTLAGLDGGQIALVQFSDAPDAAPADLVAESRHGRRVPGDGALPLRRFVDAVTATGFDGTVTAEVLSHEVRRSEPAAAARRIHGALVDYWGVPAPGTTVVADG